MPRLFLRFPAPLADGEAARLEWLERDGAGAIAAEGRVALAEFGEVARRCQPWASDPANVVAFIPASVALALSCDVPGRSAAQRRRAAPYAVEEYVADDIDTMQVACGAMLRGEPVHCLAMPRAGVERYLNALAAAGVAPGWLTTDALALQARPATISVFYLGEDAALVRAGQESASVDAANLPAAVEALRGTLEEAEGAPKLRQLGGRLSDIALAAFAAEDIETEPRDGSVLARLALEFDPDGAINLLQGDYAPKRAPSSAEGQWRKVAAFAGAGIALGLAALAAQGVWAAWRADALREEATALYRDIYDVESVPGNAATRMRFRLGQAPASRAGFHFLLGNLGRALHQLGARFELTSLAYSERSGLRAELTVPSYDALETLEDSLTGRGVQLEVVSAEQDGAVVHTNLRVAEAG